jgi:hypothetical protein
MPCFYAGATACTSCPAITGEMSGFRYCLDSLTLTLFLHDDAAIQGSSTPASCSQSATIFFAVVLPMAKSYFIANQDLYISSVAQTAGVKSNMVKILSIDEVSTRSSRIVTGRLLLAASIQVQTSVIVAVGQHTDKIDQNVLNGNLNKNGLPSGTLVVQTPSVVVTAPASGPGDSNVPVGPIIGGTVGFLVLLAVAFLAKTSLVLPSFPNIEYKSSIFRIQPICFT